MLRITVAAVVMAALLAPALAPAATAPKGAKRAARAHAVDHYPTPSKVRVSFSLRSGIDRRWSLVTGSYGRRGLWAAWVRRTSSGRYRVELFRTRNFDPGSRPPCDIKPAFSEPDC